MRSIFHIAYNVTDLADVRRFYGEVLGCEEGRSTDTWVDFNFFGHQISLHLGKPFEVTRTGRVGDHTVMMPHLGVVLPLGKLTTDQMRGLASLAHDLGDGDIRLTVWQNLLISGVAAAHVEAAVARIDALGLSTKATSIRAGLVACTGSTGCRFAAAHTKENAEEIARWCEARVELDQPINIHLTGCHHSCAQHYIGDIGMIGARVPINDDGDTVDGYHIHVGGGFGVDGAIGHELYQNITSEDAPRTIERMLKTYMQRRADASETFQAFTRRYEAETLKALIEETAP